MEELELLGAPRAWLWVVLGGTALAIPALLRGFIRRGKGPRHERRLWLQRVPQLAAGINLSGAFPCARASTCAPGIASWLGVLLSAAGIALLVSSWIALGSSFSPDAEIVHGHQLRQAGPYRFILHPVYAGLVTFLVGSAVTALSPLCALVTVGLVAPLFLQRAKYEESLLVGEFGDAYLAYARRLGWRRLVPVFIPFGV